MAERSKQNLNYLEKKRAFKVKQNPFFIIFKKLPVTKNGRRPESATLFCDAFALICNLKLVRAINRNFVHTN